jgi:hypothetical protein
MYAAIYVDLVCIPTPQVDKFLKQVFKNTFAIPHLELTSL